jgi:hypothetical protein
LATAVAHCQFWASAEGLVTSVNSKAIHHLKILTYRYVKRRERTPCPPLGND